jgi:hypothetical protein
MMKLKREINLTKDKKNKKNKYKIKKNNLLQIRIE